MTAETRPAPRPDAVVIECELAHPPEKVWRALTTPALLAKWLAANDIEPRLGARFRVEPEDGPAAECEVVEIEVGRSLAFTWRIDGSGPSVVRFDLLPTPDGTALRIAHTGLPTAVAAVAPRRLRPRPTAGPRMFTPSNRTSLRWAA